MFKVIATDVVISKGYDGAPALKFSETGRVSGSASAKGVRHPRRKQHPMGKPLCKSLWPGM